MRIDFSKNAYGQLKDWRKSNKAVADKIYELIDDIKTNGLLSGKGKPEKLRHYKNPVRFSREINRVDRLVYSYNHDDNILLILSCKGHYEDR